MAEQIEEDDASWSEVLATLALTGVTGAVFLTIFEVARRVPSLTEVFDRRRMTKPFRTPPPLLRNSIFEWLFLSTEPIYSEYSDLAHMGDVLKEKRRQRNPGHAGIFSGLFRRKNPDKQKKKKEEGQRHHSNHGDDGPPAEILQVHSTFSGSDGIEVHSNHSGSDGIEIQHQTSGPNYYNSDYPPDSNQNKVNTNIIIKTHLTPNVEVVHGRRLPKEIAEYAKANDLSEEQMYDYEQRLLEQERLDEIEFQKRRRDQVERMSNFQKFFMFSNHFHIDSMSSNALDLESQLSSTDLSGIEKRTTLNLPPRKSRFWYIGFEQGEKVSLHNNQSVSSPINTSISSGGAIPGSLNVSMSVTDPFAASPANSHVSSKRLDSPRSLFRRMLSTRYKSVNHASQQFAAAPQVSDPDNNFINRHLKSISVQQKRPLSGSDKELLRCIGLDTFVMIRFLRFCFDVTFYPFICACIFLMPTYCTNDFNGIFEDVNTQTDGYFCITINRLEPKSLKLWVPWGFSFCYYIWILRRLWVEWETFIPLRFDFLVNGDVENEKPEESTSFKSRAVVSNQNDVQLHLEQYRNSVLVEFVPESHRRGQELFQFFDAVFPGQVKRAEILLNATELTRLINKRQSLIEKFENIYAESAYERKMYNQMKENAGNNKKICCFHKTLKKPEDPTTRIGKSMFCCGKKVVKALPYYTAEINNLSRKVSQEYKRVTYEQIAVEDTNENKEAFHHAAAAAQKFITGKGGDLKCDTGFLEFTNLTTKQSAVQCNITGSTGYMVTTSAPDPRDILWENATVEKQSIIVKRAQCGLLLLVGTLFWLLLVGSITSISNLEELREKGILPQDFLVDKDSFWYDLVQGYIPVIILELIMLVVPFILRIIATKFIRLKTHSEIDQFVYKWHFGYRITNLVSIIVRQQVLKTLSLFFTNPRSTIDYLTGSIASSSQFFLNNMLISAGTETLFELSQITKICRHFIRHQFVTIEATSKRQLERMREPISLEWGEKVPMFIFALLVATMYSAIVPIVMGSCALYFFIAAKVYTHQALFIYAQPYEGGGKLMYQLNRSVLGIVYISIMFFAAIIYLQGAEIFAVGIFLVVMLLITFIVDRRITTTFVNPSTTLAMTNARIIDEETNAIKERSRLYREFRDAKKRKRREENEENSRRNNYLPAGTLPTLSESNSFESNGLGPSAGIESDEGLRRRHHTTRSSGDEDDMDMGNKTIEFYLYRQPQLNKELWETGPRID